MAGGLFSRLVTRPTGGTISGPNDDAEWDNIISNMLPAKIDDYAATTGQMDSTSDPYPGSSQTQAISLAGELEQLRYVIDEMHGGAKWYISEQLLGLSGGTMTGTIVLPNGSVAVPSIGIGATDKGFWESSTNVIGVTIGSSNKYFFAPGSFSVNDAAGAALMNEAATSTNPTLIPNKADPDTGIGWNTDELHMIVNGSSVGYFDSTGIVASGITVSSALGAGAATANTLYTENTAGGWAHWTGATPPVKVDDFNVSGVTRTSAGLFVISWDTDFVDANYFVTATARNADNAYCFVVSVTAGTVTVQVKDHNGTASDPTALYVMAMGAQ